MRVGLSVAQKQMCQISGRGLIGGCQGIVYRAAEFINTNGPAVEGVNVGGAVRRFESWYFSRKDVPADKPPWRNFCKSRYRLLVPIYHGTVCQLPKDLLEDSMDSLS